MILHECICFLKIRDVRRFSWYNIAGKMEHVMIYYTGDIYGSLVKSIEQFRE